MSPPTDKTGFFFSCHWYTVAHTHSFYFLVTQEILNVKVNALIYAFTGTKEDTAQHILPAPKSEP